MAGIPSKFELGATVPRPRRWDLDATNRYLAHVTVGAAGKVVDVYGQPFGFRTIEFTPRDGFKLNGRRVAPNGTCNHHDLGALGAALNLRALERQLEILKEMGCNAPRTSHNPPAPELLELADRMGFVVMVEAFECWKRGETADDYSRLFDQWLERDLKAMVRRERNHPSVILWSIGNEIAEQNGPQLAKPRRLSAHPASRADRLPGFVRPGRPHGSSRKTGSRRISRPLRMSKIRTERSSSSTTA